jgi:hypothetical protein
MNYKRLFLNWLKQHHIRDKFLYNCRTVRSSISSRRYPPIKYIWKEDPFFYIVNSFAWSESSQGNYFWSLYDRLWRDFFNKYTLTHSTK